MNRYRIASITVAIAAVGAFLAGCNASDEPKTTWNAAPAPSASASTVPASGAGGGEGTSALPVAARGDASGVPGVQATTESAAVALTFDDGPDPNYTPKMLALLKKHDVKATFCVVGVQVEQFPQLVRDIVADGHTLCNHTWKHDTTLGTRGESVRLQRLRFDAGTISGLDLAQAEAVADLIEASTEAAAKSASASLTGAFSRAIHELVDKVIHLRMLVEATLDFPEEEIDFLEKSDARGQLVPAPTATSRRRWARPR